MSERRSLRSDKDVNLQMLDLTPRKSSRTPSKLSSLQNTPEFAEMERRSSRAVRSRKSREPELELGLHMENNNSILNSSNVMNNSKFDPDHLYGLDNPDSVSAGKEEGSKKDSEPEPNVGHNGIKLNFYWISFAFSVFTWLILIGAMVRLNNLIHDKLEKIFIEKIANKEWGLKQLEERISKLEKSDKLCNAQSYKKVILDDQAVKGNAQDLIHLVTMRIDQALERWDADKMGIPDFALESAGGQIHSAYHSATFSNGSPQLLVFGIPLWYEVRTPRIIIQPGNSPGECWAFHGKEGYVVIKLSQMIRPSSFTLEHMSTSLSQFADNSIPSAPRDFSVWGWSDAHGKEKTKLGEYVYDQEGTALQNFPVQVSTESNFRFIELRVHSNYGNPSYTCLYRFRVHGDPYKESNDS